MVSVQRVSLVTEGHEADERVIRQYVIPALDRLNEVDGCNGVRYSRFGVDPRWEKSEIKLGIYGDYEAVIEAEKERWDELVDDGLIESWSRDGAPFTDMPDEVQEFLGQLYIVASRMSAEYYREFDERPDMLDELPDAELSRPVGWRMLLHVLVNQVGYTPDEEIDAYMGSIRGRLAALTEFEDYDYVRDTINDLRKELDDAEEKVNELEEQGGFEYYSGPE